MRKIRVAIAGVGNCASSLVQGLEYYKGRHEGAFAGLMHARIGDWGPSDIEIVTAFDIDRRKVGKRVEEAIFAKTQREIPRGGGGGGGAAPGIRERQNPWGPTHGRCRGGHGPILT